MPSLSYDNAIVPEFIINPTNLFIFENAGVVEVCVSSESLFERNVIVTAETGPKVGAVNQATGKYIYHHKIVVNNGNTLAYNRDNTSCMFFSIPI